MSKKDASRATRDINSPLPMSKGNDLKIFHFAPL